MKFKDQFYLILAGIFIASLVTCNLIANKFVTVDLGFKVFIVSAGILPYPLTFLVTDLISELYGQKKANQVVFSGFIASLFVLLFLWLGAQPDALNRMEIKTSSNEEIDLKLIENLSKVDFLKSMTAAKRIFANFATFIDMDAIYKLLKFRRGTSFADRVELETTESLPSLKSLKRAINFYRTRKLQEDRGIQLWHDRNLQENIEQPKHVITGIDTYPSFPEDIPRGILWRIANNIYRRYRFLRFFIQTYWWFDCSIPTCFYRPCCKKKGRNG